MKILALNPPFLKGYSRQSRSPCVAKGGTIYYPYYLAYAAGVAEQAGHTVKLVDGVIEDWTHKDAANFAKGFNPDLVVMDTSTPSIKNDIQVAIAVKQAAPNAHMNLVGTLPTNLPEWLLNQTELIDSAARGEYDLTTMALAEALEKGRPLDGIPGISFRHASGFAHTGPAKLVEDLDQLPFAAEIYMKHLGKERIKKYFYASITWPEIQILTARGCPYNCSFCNIPMKKSYRTRSVKSVADEFEYIQNEMPWLSEIMLEDDTFPVQKDRTVDICKELISRKIDVTWSCNARVNMDTETMDWMKKAGCRLMCVGFESPTQQSLNAVIKGTTQDMQMNFMENVKKTGLLINGCFILGLPHDNQESMMRTIQFAKILNPNTAQFYPLMVYPGTGAYAWAKHNGFLETEDFDKWLTDDGLHNTPVSRPDLSREEVLKWCNRARLEFYVKNPRYLAKVVQQAVTDPREGVRIIKGGTTLGRHLFKYLFTSDAKVNMELEKEASKLAPPNDPTKPGTSNKLPIAN
ncbi:MAG: radical SAM protein [Candidatus Aenigmarchaeota archaeon]|nr:radical SAM protein [Candidatus Aenigmarchaeota archaeon]